jgi:hypothetical protein
MVSEMCVGGTEVELPEAAECCQQRVCSRRSISVMTGFFNSDRGTRFQLWGCPWTRCNLVFSSSVCIAAVP